MTKRKVSLEENSKKKKWGNCYSPYHALVSEVDRGKGRGGIDSVGTNAS